MRTGCAVKNCNPKGYRSFRFPRNIARAEKWRSLCGNDALLERDVTKLHNQVCICEKHFPRSQFTNSLMIRLNRNAMPLLFLPLQLHSGSDVPSHSPPRDSPLVLFHDDSCNSDIPNTDFVENTHTSSKHACSPDFSPPGSPKDKPSSEHMHISPSITAINTTDSKLSLDRKPSSSSSASIQDVFISPASAQESILEELTENRRDAHIFTEDAINLEIQRKEDNKTIVDISSLSNERFLSPAGLDLGSKVEPKGRWSFSDRLVAHSLLKNDPKAYEHLSSIFPLSAKSALLPQLLSAPFCTGLNVDIMNHLSQAVQKLQVGDRVCCLMFDEIAIKPHLVYNSEEDLILGYEDHGSKGRFNAIAHRALVFMICGVLGNWKQPLSYYFSRAATHSDTLVYLIKEVLKALQGIGLTVIATVCDMSVNNVEALHLLGASFSKPSFDFEDSSVVTIFDPPQLLKCFCKLFMKYNVLVDVSIRGRTNRMLGKWEHVKLLAEDSASYSPFDPISRLAERVLTPHLHQEITVSLAAEILSRTVGCGIEAMVDKDKMEIEALATSKFILEIDRLFDSLNCDSSNNQSKKVLKHSVTKDSFHHKYWESAVLKLEKLEFRNGGRVVCDPSQKGWIATVKACVILWDRLKHFNIHSLCTRLLNLDPLQDLFNAIQQSCEDDHVPTADKFISSLKTLVVNGLVSSQPNDRTVLDA